jgi:hypothetical protein
MTVVSENIRQFLVAPRDARSFSITRVNGKPTIVYDVDALVWFMRQMEIAKAALRK